MITQALITVALGCLSGLISGSVAFLAMRVFPVIYGKTGIDGWIERRTGFGLSTGIIWLFGVVTRSWVGLYFGILFIFIGAGVFAPPIYSCFVCSLSRRYCMTPRHMATR